MTVRTRPKPTNAPHTDKLAALREQAVKARSRAREAQLAHQAAVDEIDRLREERIRALTRDDEQTARQLEGEREEADRRAADLSDRAEAAERQLQETEAELGAYAAAHLHEHLRERGPAAEATARAVEDAVAGLESASRRWHTEQAAVVELLRLAGHPTGDLPTFPAQLTDLTRAARRSGGVSVPPPDAHPAAATTKTDMRRTRKKLPREPGTPQPCPRLSPIRKSVIRAG